MSDQRVFVFDADGVVIEPWGFANRLSDDFGITRDRTIDFFKGPFQQCLIGDAELRPHLVEFLDKWGWKGTVDELIELWMEADDLPCKSALAKVAELRELGHLCCVASNQERTRAEYIAQKMGFEELFDYLFFSCDLGVMKPQEAFYSSIEAAINVSSSRIVFLDDTIGHVEGAKKAGWNAIHYTSIEDLARVA